MFKRKLFHLLKEIIIFSTLIIKVCCVSTSVNNKEEVTLLENTYNRLGAPKGTDLYELDDKITAIYRNPLPEKGGKMLFYLRMFAITLQRYVDRTLAGDSTYKEMGKKLISKGEPRFFLEPTDNDNKLWEKIKWDKYEYQTYMYLRLECRYYFKELERVVKEDPACSRE